MCFSLAYVHAGLLVNDNGNATHIKIGTQFRVTKPRGVRTASSMARRLPDAVPEQAIPNAEVVDSVCSTVASTDGEKREGRCCAGLMKRVVVG